MIDHLLFLLLSICLERISSQTIPVGPPFPFYTGVLSDTNSCSQNFKSACTEGCQGDILTFSACGGTDNNQDTFFKLYLGETEVDLNDDYCSASSQIQYTVNDSGCNDYCLHMGCFGLASCEANVTATILKVASPLPTVQPTLRPTASPSLAPTSQPTSSPVGGRPTSNPTSMPTSSPTGIAQTISVNYLLDAIEANSTNCYPTLTAFCNLRSAWLACGLVPLHSLCVITLPPGARVVMENIDKGGLILEEHYNVQVIGSNSIIVGQEGVVPPIPTVPIGFPFPLYTGELSNTATCTQNTAVACTEGCLGNTLVFTACDGDLSQDTFFKLYQGNETLVAENDDACGSASSIEFTVQSMGCSQYCLHMGCFGSLTCSANVSATLEATAFITPRFIFYERNTSVDADVVPQLSLTDLTVMNFGGDNFYGGSLYLEGTVDLYLSRVSFVNSTGELGGSMYVSFNDRVVLIDNCTFTNSTAQQSGGAIYIDQYVSSVIVSNAVFSQCIGGTSGGAMYIADDNFGVQIVNSTFRHCQALGVISSTGGAITVDANNNNFLLMDSVFEYCSSTFYGGAVSSLYNNANSLILRSTFLGCNAGYGGALFVNVGADGLQVIDSTFTNCSSSTDGGAIYLYVGNPDVSFYNIAVTGAYCGNDGGGIFSFQNNANLLVSNSVFDLCHADGYGGGVAVMFSHTDSTIVDSTFIGCSSFSGGGGIVILQDNSDVIVTDSVFAYCTSVKTGGGLSFDTANSAGIVSGSAFDSCSSSDGGGLHIGTANNQIAVVSTNFSLGYATGGGGAIFLDSNNVNITINGGLVINSSSAVTGGGLYVNSNNDQVSITGSSFINCSSASGGGIFLFTDNDNFSLVSSRVSGCSATTGSGGGLYVEQSNSQLGIISSNVTNNFASVSGGGAAFLSNNTGVTLGGSIFAGNTVNGVGGSVYVGFSHAQFVTIDLQGQEDSAVVQSQHPYESGYPVGGVPYVIVGQTVTVTSAPISGFLINFDSATAINTMSDALLIYNNADKDVLLYSSTASGGGWPGINVPSLMISNFSSIFILFTGSNSFNIYPTTYTDNYYGFKCYVYPVFTDPLVPAVFSDSVSQAPGGALYFYSNNQFVVTINTNIYGNNAQTGAGCFIRDGNNGATFTQSSFINNRAKIDGAAVVIYTTHYGVVFRACDFTSNSAGNEGGAINMVTGNGVGLFLTGNEIVCSECTFTNNSASTGGALYLNDDNVVILKNCTMSSNSAISGVGGAMAPDQNNKLTITHSTFEWNSAMKYGGAIASILANSIVLRHTTVRSNTAGIMGGGLVIMDSSAVEFVDLCTFSDNSASFAGGALALVRSPLWNVGTNGSVVLESNVALVGSAMFFQALDVGTGGEALSNLLVTNNTATVGGTAYWLYDESMRAQPAGLTSPSVVWEGNIAPYGAVVGTQAVTMNGPQQYDVQVYGQALSPAIVYSLSDFYGQSMPLEGTTSVDVSISTSYVSCFGQSPSISGADAQNGGVLMTAGEAAFSALEVLCAPLGNMTLMFEAQLGDQLGLGSIYSNSYYIQNTTVLSFRSCVAGEKYTPKQCEVCPFGSYSLHANSDSCVDCLSTPGITECYADQIILERGFWRRQPSAQDVLKCPHYHGCTGGNLTGDSSCALGYEGPLCSVCSKGFFPVESSCLPCDNKDFFTPTLIGYIGLFFALMVGAGISFYFYHRVYLSERKEDDDGVSLNDVASSSVSDTGWSALAMLRGVYVWMVTNRKQITSKLKVLVSTYQIVTAASVVLSVNLPHSYTSFIDIASFLNLNLTSALPINCTDSFNFIDSLIMTTMAPLGFAGCLVLAFCAEYFYRRRIIQRNPHRVRGEKKRTFSRLRYKYISFFFYLTYLVLPSVTTKIFQIFPCENVDPSHDDDATSDLFLKADMSISCTTDYYYSAVSYASIMIVVYPVGIPLLYFYLLYSHRETLRERGDSNLGSGVSTGISDNSSSIGSGSSNGSSGGSGGSKSKISGRDRSVSSEVASSVELGLAVYTTETELPDSEHQSAAAKALTSRPSMASELAHVLMSPDADEDEAAGRINFLWEAYQPRYWYWEVIETTRRLMLTAVLSVCAPGTPSQGVLAVLLSMLYIKTYAFFRPYALMNDNTLQEVGQYQIFFTFFGSLVVQNELINQSLNDLLGAALIFINLAVIFFSLFFVFYISFVDQGSFGAQREQERRGGSKEPPRRLSALELEMQSFFNEKTVAPAVSMAVTATHYDRNHDHYHANSDIATSTNTGADPTLVKEQQQRQQERRQQQQQEQEQEQEQERQQQQEQERQQQQEQERQQQQEQERQQQQEQERQQQELLDELSRSQEEVRQLRKQLLNEQRLEKEQPQTQTHTHASIFSPPPPLPMTPVDTENYVVEVAKPKTLGSPLDAVGGKDEGEGE